MTTDNDFIRHLQAETERQRAELHTARQRERDLLALLGLLREGVGALWIVCRAALDESNADANLPDGTYESALKDIDGRLRVVDAHFGHHRHAEGE